MALPKTLAEIMATLARIEAKQDKQLALSEQKTMLMGEDRIMIPGNAPMAQQAEYLAKSLAYDSYVASEIYERIPSLSPQELLLLQMYEESHKNRKGVMSALLDAIGETIASSPDSLDDETEKLA